MNVPTLHPQTPFAEEPRHCSPAASGQVQQETASLQFLSLREGCAAIRETIDQLQTTNRLPSLRNRTNGLLRCIEHEASMIEELPAELLEDSPCRRIVSYCRTAAVAITKHAQVNRTVDELLLATKLCSAFLSLIPRVLEDFQRCRRYRFRLECDARIEPTDGFAGAEMPG